MKKEFLNEKIETMSTEELRPIQEEKFLKQIEYVWEKSAFYQKKFKEHGIERGDIRGLEDLPKLPFTEKDELRDSQEVHPPLGFHCAAPMDDIIRIHSSSGTTGVMRPTRGIYTARPEGLDGNHRPFPFCKGCEANGRCDPCCGADLFCRRASG